VRPICTARGRYVRPIFTGECWGAGGRVARREAVVEHKARDEDRRGVDEQ